LSFYKSTSLANEDAQALAKFMVFMGEFYWLLWQVPLHDRYQNRVEKRQKYDMAWRTHGKYKSIFHFSFFIENMYPLFQLQRGKQIHTIRSDSNEFLGIHLFIWDTICTNIFLFTLCFVPYLCNFQND
jgi:hypothetical protein